MFLDCAYISHKIIKIMALKPKIFKFLTSSLEQPAVGASCYAKRLPKPMPLYLFKLW